jgi:hypothetical protein
MRNFVWAVLTSVTSGIPTRHTTPAGQSKAMEWHTIDDYLRLHEKFYNRSITFIQLSYMTCLLYGFKYLLFYS